MAIKRALFVSGPVLLTLALGSGSRVAADTAQDRAVRSVLVVARRWEFQPNRIEVTEGDHVRLVVYSEDGTHGFACKKLGIRREIPRTGEPIVITFDAVRPGTFAVWCSEYCGLGHDQMGATIVVAPRASR